MDFIKINKSIHSFHYAFLGLEKSWKFIKILVKLDVNNELHLYSVYSSLLMLISTFTNTLLKSC